MKRFFFLILALFFLAFHSVCLAQPVPENIAAIVARNWLVQHGSGTAIISVNRLVSTKRQNQPSLYYLFNSDSTGWVIVSADDVAWPVIAYSPKGHNDLQHQPPAYIAWMRQVAEHITVAIRESRQQNHDSDPVTTKIKAAWRLYADPDFSKQNIPDDSRSSADQRKAVAPLIKTTWSQGQYYNTNCPDDADGRDSHALVGCVATAMGQIMKYHEWPSSGTGSHSYRPESHPEYGVLSVDFGATSYDWANMPDNGSLTSYNGAVATLLYHAGVSVDMDYGPDSSGASGTKIPAALQDYFKYETDDFRIRSLYSSSFWISLLKSNLDAGLPILYMGSGDDRSGGHAFVCDGYEGTNYFHFNWGWNGWLDGYFYLDDLTPGNDDYSYYQGAVTGIQRPGQLPDLSSYRPKNWNDVLPVSTTQLAGGKDHADSGPYYDYQTLYLNYGIANDSHTSDAGSFTVRIEVTGEGGDTFNFPKSSLPLYTYDYNQTDFAIGPLSAGTHTIKMWVDSNNNINESNEDNNYYERTLTVLGAEKPDLTPYQPSIWNDKIPVSRTRLMGNAVHDDSGPYYAGQELFINRAIGNQGKVSAGAVTYKIEITGEGGISWTDTTMAISAGYYSYYVKDYPIGQLAPGTHTIKLWIDYNDEIAESDETNNYYERTISIVGCKYSISPTKSTHPAVGDSGFIRVTSNGNDCSWSASTTADWITITSGSSGTGSGTVNYKLDANSGSTSRSSVISVAGKNHTVTQEGKTVDSDDVVYINNDGHCNGHTPCHDSIGGGCRDIANNGEVKITAGRYFEDLAFANTKTVRLSGGWNQDYNGTTAGESEICGSVTISSGTLVIDKLSIAGNHTTTITSNLSYFYLRQKESISPSQYMAIWHRLSE